MAPQLTLCAVALTSHSSHLTKRPAASGCGRFVYLAVRLTGLTVSGSPRPGVDTRMGPPRTEWPEMARILRARVRVRATERNALLVRRHATPNTVGALLRRK